LKKRHMEVRRVSIGSVRASAGLPPLEVSQKQGHHQGLSRLWIFPDGKCRREGAALLHGKQEHGPRLSIFKIQDPTPQTTPGDAKGWKRVRHILALNSVGAGPWLGCGSPLADSREAGQTLRSLRVHRGVISWLLPSTTKGRSTNVRVAGQLVKPASAGLQSGAEAEHPSGVVWGVWTSPGCRSGFLAVASYI
jgi:hypothetical protein